MYLLLGLEGEDVTFKIRKIIAKNLLEACPGFGTQHRYEVPPDLWVK